jgi:hypothetical protein
MIKMGKRRPGAAVIPGPDGAVVGIALACVACGTTGTGARQPLSVGHGETAFVCDDAAACAKRYRAGATPQSYAAGLRGELLAVTP